MRKCACRKCEYGECEYGECEYVECEYVECEYVECEYGEPLVYVHCIMHTIMYLYPQALPPCAIMNDHLQ